MKSVGLVAILASSLLAACATAYAPITRETLGRTGERPSDFAVLAMKDLGLNVLLVDGVKPTAEAVYVKPGRHRLLIEVMRVSPSRGIKAVMEADLVAEARRAYAIFVVFHQDLSGYDIYSDDKGDSYDPECFFSHRSRGPDSRFTRCPDAMPSPDGDLLSSEKRVTETSRRISGTLR